MKRQLYNLEQYEDEYKITTGKSGLMLLHYLFPTMFINELLLGQRVPQVSLEEKHSKKPRMERTFIPCPHCKTVHDARIWGNKRGFKNWFGLYCPSCDGVIPCLWNLFSLLVLIVTYPLWIGFKKPLKEKWLANQPKRYKNIELLSANQFLHEKGWLTMGLQWGVFMFIFMTFLYPLFTNDPITWQSVAIGIPIWALGGLGFGYFMKIFMGKKVS